MELKLARKALVTGGAGFLGRHLCRRIFMEGVLRLEDWIAVAGKVSWTDPKRLTCDELDRN